MQLAANTETGLLPIGVGQQRILAKATKDAMEEMRMDEPKDTYY